MKRMTANPISYYTIKKEDMKNFTPVEDPNEIAFSYTPSEEFLEVLKEFKDVLIADWSIIYPEMITSYRTRLSVLYPSNIEDLPATDDKVGYRYNADTVNGYAVKPTFTKQGGIYYIKFNSR